MARTYWFDRLLSFLRDQPREREILTLALTELETLIGQPLPSSAVLRSYWLNRQTGSMGPRLAAVGWRVERVQRHDDFTITFVRRSSETNV